MNKKIQWFTLLLLIFTSAQAQPNAKMQSVFIYNFTRLIAWPADYQNGDFVIAVFGNSPIVPEIQEMAKTKKAGNQNIVSKVFNSTDDISKCHIIFIPSNQSRKISEIASALQEKNINALIITETRNAITNGAVINFTVVDDRQRFEMSQGNARKMGLNPGGEITRLAILTD
jgi:hypothetical protein